jgi:hypothetical protein
LLGEFFENKFAETNKLFAPHKRIKKGPQSAAPFIDFHDCRIMRAVARPYCAAGFTEK